MTNTAVLGTIARMAAEGMSQSQIASEVGLSQGRVSQLLAEAQEHARQALLTDAEHVEVMRLSRGSGLPSLPPLEHGPGGEVVCAAEFCTEPSVYPTNACEEHGGTPEAARGARVALLDLVNPAIRRLGDLVHSGDERVALAASTAVLDRTGFAKQVEITVTDARQVIFERLMAARDEYLAQQTVAGEIVEAETLVSGGDLL